MSTLKAAHFFFSEPTDKYGSCCFYYRVSRQVGLKMYPWYPDTGWKTFSRQLHYHMTGLAPKCWGFESDGNVSAYYTEHVDIECRKKDSDLHFLISKFSGYNMDMSCSNWGYLHGKPVIVDFSCMEIK